jgi:hypothetical protein
VLYRSFNFAYRPTTGSCFKYQEKLLRGYYLTLVVFMLFLCLVLILSSFE